MMMLVLMVCIAFCDFVLALVMALFEMLKNRYPLLYQVLILLLDFLTYDDDDDDHYCT